ncbi:MAG: acyltransferase family protein [Thainema sp.]
MKKRLVVLDWMRALAILVILFHHLPGYTFNYYDLNNFGVPLDLSLLNVFNRYIGLSLFVFTSGYLLNSRKNHSFDLAEAKKFILKRWIRIFPLYLVAFAAFIILYEIFNPTSILVHLFGLQLLVESPNFRPIRTLWFIGLIVAYYSIFMVWKSALSQNVKLCIITGFPILIFTLNAIWQATDFRLLLYYGVFWYGMYCGASKILDKSPKSFSIIFFLILLFITLLMNLTGYASIRNPDASLLNLLRVNIWMICFVTFSYYALRYLPEEGLSFFLFEKVAYASYCIYLFHRPVLSVASKIIEKAIPGDNLFIFSSVMIVTTLPVMFVICQKIQQLYDRQITPRLESRLLQPAISNNSRKT